MINEALVNVTQNDGIEKNLTSFNYKIVVLDDDPTGTQTVKDLPVYTEWTEEWIEDGFKQENAMFYILTNSRALTEAETITLHQEISRNIEKVAQKLGQPYLVISRGDSTLRGHFYLEPKVLSESAQTPFDAVFYLPQFFEGQRYTYHGIHYLKDEDGFKPVSESEFANDTTFGYEAGNMRDFIAEKSQGVVDAESVFHITLEHIRNRDVAAITSIFERVSHFDAVIVDALNDEDMDYFVACLTTYLNTHDKKFIFRTAASFVKAICQTPGTLIALEQAQNNDYGGVVIVGSHVKKSTDQLSHLLSHTDIVPIEFDVNAVVREDIDTYIKEQIVRVEQHIQAQQNVVVFTTRDVIKTQDLNQNLNISTRISDSLVSIIQGLSVQPKFIIAKGGITSSDVATKGLGIKKAVVLGQIAKGIPVWLTGQEAKYPNMPYIIFPGNVGHVDTLAEVYDRSH